MKTSWLNGSKRILSALLIAAALMFGWTPLGEGKALAATDKGNDLGQQFADAAMLFVRENNYYLNLYNNQNTPFFYRGSWCATFVSVVARQIGIPTSLIPSSTFADDYGPDPSTRITGFHPYHESAQTTLRQRQHMITVRCITKVIAYMCQSPVILLRLHIKARIIECLTLALFVA